MKVTHEKVVPPPAVTDHKVTLTLNNKEFAALQLLVKYDYSVPATLYETGNCSSDQQLAVQNLLQNIHKVIA